MSEAEGDDAGEPAPLDTAGKDAPDTRTGRRPAAADAANATSAVAATIETLRRKGFGRLLVDDRAVAFDEIEAAALAGRSTLQVVVDRVQVGGEETRQRLTDSIETAYREGGGAAWAIEVPATTAAEQDAGSTPPAPTTHRFSERFECRECGIAYEDPQPRLFSFNNPFGACPTCHGFGNIIELDMNLVVPDTSKSIAAERDRAVEQAALSDRAGRAEASRAQAQDPPRRAVGRSDRG